MNPIFWPIIWAICGIYCILFLDHQLCPVLFMTVSYDHFAIFLKSHPAGGPSGHPGSAFGRPRVAWNILLYIICKYVHTFSNGSPTKSSSNWTKEWQVAKTRIPSCDAFSIGTTFASDTAIPSTIRLSLVSVPVLSKQQISTEKIIKTQIIFYTVFHIFSPPTIIH